MMQISSVTPRYRDAAGEILRQLREPKKVALGVSYEGRDPALLEMALPFIDYIEVTPETIAEASGDDLHLSPEVMAELRNLPKSAKIIVHGVSLSIGSHDGWSESYLRLLDEFIQQVDVVWHSEHLGYTRVDGSHLGIMLGMPRTEEALDLICERVTSIRERYGIPFLLENIVRVLPDPPSTYSDAAFLNAMADRTGCGLILDVYNLECDAHNRDLDIARFMDELDASHVRELHVACGVEHNGIQLDVHSRIPRECTLGLAGSALSKPGCNAEVMVFEFMPEAVPGLGREAIANTLQHLRARFGG